MTTRTLVTALAGLAFTGLASADLITADSVTDNGVTDLVNTNVAAASDGDIDGFSAGGTGLWFTPDVGAAGGDYFGEGGAVPVLTFSFNTATEIDAIAYWANGFGGINKNSAQTATLEFKLSGSSIETVNFNPALLANTVQQDFDLQDDLGLSTDTVTVDQIVLTITDNFYDDGSDGGDRTAFAELQFNQVPEPGSLALLALGGLLVGRRRRG